MKSFTVLVVDDNRDWCAALKAEVEQYPLFEVLPPLHNGKDAIDYIEVKKPDVIILDLIMPVCDGLYVIDHIRKNLYGYAPYIYVLSAIGTEKTNKILRSKDVNYYSVKPIETQVVAHNLYKLIQSENGADCDFVNPAPLLGLENQVEGFLFELGAPLYLLSTKCTAIALQICIADETKLNSIIALYAYVSESWTHPASPTAVERNIRTTIKKMQKSATPYFGKCFPYGGKKLTNSNFLNSAVYFYKRRIEERYGDQIFVRKYSEAHRPE